MESGVLLLDKMKRQNILIKNKKAVSPILGYVLLVTLGLVMSGMAYNYLKTYVPQEAVGCPEGVSIFIKDYKYDCLSKQFNITLKNNGKFDMAGYFIHAIDNPKIKIATINLADNFTGSSKGEAGSRDGYIVYSVGKNNFMTPKINAEHRFQVATPNIIAIEITPVRYEIIDNKPRLAICSSSIIRESIKCL